MEINGSNCPEWGKEKRQSKVYTYFSKHKARGIKSSISLTTLNVNDINFPIKAEIIRLGF